MEGKITIRRNPIRATKRNRFSDEKIWVTSSSTTPSSILSPSPVPTSRPTLKCASSNSGISQKSSVKDSSKSKSVSVSVIASSTVPVSVPSRRLPPPPGTKLKIVQQSASTSTVAKKLKSHNPKKFIRFRFQLDCVEAVDLDVDKLVTFLKLNMKIEGQKNNLSEVAMERRNANVNILTKVMVKKKYLKHLAKKFLRGVKLHKYRVISKNKRAYKIVPK